MKEATLSIGELAARAGVSVSALRYYERIGLLPAAEREHGRRRFPAATLHRLQIVATAKRAGFSLREVGALLAAADRNTADGGLRDLAAAKLPEVDAEIAEAESKRAWLLAAKSCRCASLDDCALFAA
jgi:MerR family redox-sensitive transcriptional activator SoxR